MKTHFIYRSFSAKVQWFFCVLTLGVLGIIIVQSLGQSHASISVNHLDKVAHALAYCGLGLVALPALARVRAGFVWLGMTMFGIGIEGLQGAMNLGRKADVLDALANASGALMAVVAWLVLSFIISWLRNTDSP